MRKNEKKLIEALNSYIAECSNGGKSGKRIPNICGLCRHMGIGKREMMAMLAKSEELADRIFTILEDEAVNSGATGTAYTQQFHILNESRNEVFGGDDGDGIIAIFEHSDGEE